MISVLEEAREHAARGRFSAVRALVAPLVRLDLEPVAATDAEAEINLLALRTMDDGEPTGPTDVREELERWLLRFAKGGRGSLSRRRVLHGVGLSALAAGRARRALQAAATVLRDGQLPRPARALLAELACDALAELHRHATARSFALRELSRAPHEKLDWLFLRRAALSSSALGEAIAAAGYARRCLEHPFFPGPLRSELEPLLPED